MGLKHKVTINVTKPGGILVRVIDLACGERIPEEVRLAISDPMVKKWAFNEQFERVCLSRHLSR